MVTCWGGGGGGGAEVCVVSDDVLSFWEPRESPPPSPVEEESFDEVAVDEPFVEEPDSDGGPPAGFEEPGPSPVPPSGAPVVGGGGVGTPGGGPAFFSWSMSSRPPWVRLCWTAPETSPETPESHVMEKVFSSLKSRLNRPSLSIPWAALAMPPPPSCARKFFQCDPTSERPLRTPLGTPLVRKSLSFGSMPRPYLLTTSLSASLSPSLPQWREKASA